MKGLRGDLVKFVDTGKEGPETYANAIERAIRIEAWDGPTKRFSVIEEKKGVAEHTNRFQPNRSFGNQQHGFRIKSQQSKFTAKR